ncbi:MAG: hypothetical protein DBX55_07785, partial [Verrucomicrobia bacterium]
LSVLKRRAFILSYARKVGRRTKTNAASERPIKICRFAHAEREGGFRERGKHAGRGEVAKMETCKKGGL